MKCGPSLEPDALLRLLDDLNPAREAGRMTLISRFGHDKVEDGLPRLVRAVEREGHPVVWSCDPMHGNTFESKNGYKTRNFEDVLDEVRGFFEVHKAAGTFPGGVHVELTGDDVAECLGGSEQIDEASLEERYESLCDPRLNHMQSLELSFLVAEQLAKR